MKLIIAGSRTITDYGVFYGAMEQVLEVIPFGNIDEVVHGAAAGVDRLAVLWAQQVGIPVRAFPATWEVGGMFDAQAGYKRNYEMAKYGEALVAIWNGSSPGTRHMIDLCKSHGMPVVTVTMPEGQVSLFNMEEEND